MAQGLGVRVQGSGFTSRGSVTSNWTVLRKMSVSTILHAVSAFSVGIQSLRDWYLSAEQPAPAPHLAHPEGCAALRIVLCTVPCVCRSCEHFPDGFDLHLLPSAFDLKPASTLHPEPAAGFRFRVGTLRVRA